MKISNVLSKYSIHLVAIISLLIIPYSAQAAIDMFLQLDGISGESQDAVYQGSIEVIGFTEGLSTVSTINTGGGAGGSKPVLQDINITKYLDRSSPVLRQMLTEGSPIKNATLIVRSGGVTGKRFVFFQIDMTNVILTSVSTGGTGGVDRLIENVTLNFATIKWTYKPQNPDGSAGGVIVKGWDITSNSPL